MHLSSLCALENKWMVIYTSDENQITEEIDCFDGQCQFCRGIQNTFDVCKCYRFKNAFDYF